MSPSNNSGDSQLMFRESLRTEEGGGGVNGAGRGQKVARTRGVRGAKKLVAVAAAQRASRQLEPRIGSKYKIPEEFYSDTGSRKSHQSESDFRQDYTEPPLSVESHASSSSSSSSPRYSSTEKMNLSSAEMKLERMQKVANEKAEKVRKLVEEKASKIRKLAEEKANKLRCLADEKVRKVCEDNCSVLLLY